MDRLIWQIAKWPVAVALIVCIQLSGVAIYILTVQSSEWLTPLCKVEEVIYNDSLRAK